jgi:hypothetical protein
MTNYWPIDKWCGDRNVTLKRSDGLNHKACLPCWYYCYNTVLFVDDYVIMAGAEDELQIWVHKLNNMQMWDYNLNRKISKLGNIITRNVKVKATINRALMMEAASTYEWSVNFYQTTRRNIPEYSHLLTMECFLLDNRHFRHIYELVSWG